MRKAETLQGENMCLMLPIKFRYPNDFGAFGFYRYSCRGEKRELKNLSTKVELENCFYTFSLAKSGSPSTHKFP